MQCGKRYLSLCEVPKVHNRDGYAGEFAKVWVPFVGYVFASGAVFNPANGVLPQDESTVITGIKKAGVYTKGYSCNCGG